MRYEVGDGAGAVARPAHRTTYKTYSAYPAYCPRAMKWPTGLLSLSRAATLTTTVSSSPYWLRPSNSTSKGVRGEENRVSDFSSPRRQTVAKYVRGLSVEKREDRALILQHVFLPAARVPPAHPAPGRTGRRGVRGAAQAPPHRAHGSDGNFLGYQNDLSRSHETRSTARCEHWNDGARGPRKVPEAPAEPG